MIKEHFPAAAVEWKRINYAHRDGTRLTLNVTETSTGTDNLIASAKQSDLEPGRLGADAEALKARLAQFKKTLEDA